MTRTFHALLLITTVILISCHQNKPKSGTKEKPKVVIAVKPDTLIADTLIFKDAGLAALVRHTEKLFSVYDTISPNTEYDVRKFKFNKHELDYLRKIDNDSLAITNITYGFNITSALSDMICDDLTRILNWKDIEKYDLRLLLKNHLGTAISPDKKLYCFSFDARTGGTYKSAISYILYNTGTGKKYIYNDEGDNPIFNIDGYDTIDTINTKQGIKYVLSGAVVSCMTCIGNYIDVVHFEKGKFVKNFNYNVSMRTRFNMEDDGNVGISYDNKQHIIKINYTTNDMVPTCNCGNRGVIDDNSEEEDDRSGNISCMYAFNGKTFVLKSKKVRRIKASD